MLEQTRDKSKGARSSRRSMEEFPDILSEITSLLKNASLGKALKRHARAAGMINMAETRTSYELASRKKHKASSAQATCESSLK
jgi:hypothetical protein